MAQKVYRTKSQKAASRRGLKPRNKKKDKRAHTVPIFILGIGFSVLGLAQVLSPIPFHSGGGYSKGFGSSTVVYSDNESAGFGVFFALIGLVFLYWGYCAIRNERRH